MWNKGRSQLLLVKISTRSFRCIFPLPLFIFKDLLDAFKDISLLCGFLFPRFMLPSLITGLLSQSFEEMRRLGSWEFINITDGEDRILIKFY